jgi:hypothetical protein
MFALKVAHFAFGAEKRRGGAGNQARGNAAGEAIKAYIRARLLSTVLTSALIVADRIG